MKIIHQNKVFFSIMACLILIVASIVITRQYTVAAAAGADLSFATWSQVATDALNITATNGDTDPSIRTLGKSSAGGFLGFTDSPCINKSITSSNSLSNVTYEYSSLAAVGDGYLEYGEFGLALNQLGIDQTESNSFSTGIRKAVSAVVLILYLLTSFVKDFWDLVLSIIGNANPFVLFGLGPLDGATAPIGEMQTGINSIAQSVGNFYENLRDNAIAVFLPLFIAVSLFIWLVIKKGTQPLSTFKTTLIRICFVAFGVPLLFAFLGIASTLAAKLNVEAGSFAEKAIASTFVDFEHWVLAENLSTDVSGTLTVNSSGDSFRVSKTDMWKVREICSNINTIAPVQGGFGADGSFTSGGSNFNTEVFDALKNGGGSGAKAEIVDLLERYGNGVKISAGAYESKVKGKVPANELDIASVMNVDPEEFDKSYAKKKITPAKANIDDPTAYITGRFTGAATYTPFKDQSNALSDMAVYNYLSSTFDDSQITVYSAKNTSGNLAKSEHFSVNAVGSVLMQIGFIANLVVVLAAFCVISYGYGFGMMVANFKAMLKIIPAVFTGMLGSLRGIASAVILVFALMVEIIGTCMIYALACEIIGSLYKIIESPIAVLFGNILNADDSGQMLPFVVSLISSAIIVMFIKNALKWRYAICQAITEQVSNTLNKFFGTQVQAPNLGESSGSTLGFVKNAAMVGAGVALTTAGKDGGIFGKSSTSTESKSSGLVSSEGALPASASESSNGLVATGAGAGGGKSMSDSDAAAIMASRPGGPTSKASGDASASMETSTGGTVTKANGTPYTQADYEAGEVGYARDADGNFGGYIHKGEGESSAEFDDNGNLVSAVTTEGEEISMSSSTSEETTERGSLAGDDHRGSLRGGDTGGSYGGIDSRGQSYQIVNAETGAAYTQADYDNGAAYSVVTTDANGNVVPYTTADGQTLTNMNANTFVSDSSGNVVGVVAGNSALPISNTSSMSTSISDTGTGSGKVATYKDPTGTEYTIVDRDTGREVSKDEIAVSQAIGMDNVKYDVVDSDNNLVMSDVGLDSMQIDSQTGSLTVNDGNSQLTLTGGDAPDNSINGLISVNGQPAAIVNNTVVPLTSEQTAVLTSDPNMAAQLSANSSSDNVSPYTSGSTEYTITESNTGREVSRQELAVAQAIGNNDVHYDITDGSGTVVMGGVDVGSMRIDSQRDTITISDNGETISLSGGDAGLNSVNGITTLNGQTVAIMNNQVVELTAAQMDNVANNPATEHLVLNNSADANNSSAASNNNVTFIGGTIPTIGGANQQVVIMTAAQMAGAAALLHEVNKATTIRTTGGYGSQGSYAGNYGNYGQQAQQSQQAQQGSYTSGYGSQGSYAGNYGNYGQQAQQSQQAQQGSYTSGYQPTGYSGNYSGYGNYGSYAGNNISATTVEHAYVPNPYGVPAFVTGYTSTDDKGNVNITSENGKYTVRTDGVVEYYNNTTKETQTIQPDINGNVQFTGRDGINYVANGSTIMYVDKDGSVGMVVRDSIGTNDKTPDVYFVPVNGELTEVAPGEITEKNDAEIKEVIKDNIIESASGIKTIVETKDSKRATESKNDKSGKNDSVKFAGFNVDMDRIRKIISSISTAIDAQVTKVKQQNNVQRKANNGKK